MPPAERRMLLLLLGLAVAGQGLRYWVTRPGQAPGSVQLLAGLTPASPTAHRDSSSRQSQPLAPGEQINLDSAAAGEIARLPRIGPRLARTIVADRQERGPFGGLSGLDRVPGVGPGLLKVLSPHVRFSAAALPGTGSALAGMPVGAPAGLDLNRATLEELDALPGVGPAKAQAILDYRSKHGPFGEVDQLAQVPGVSSSLLNRFRDRVYVR